MKPQGARAKRKKRPVVRSFNVSEFEVKEKLKQALLAKPMLVHGIEGERYLVWELNGQLYTSAAALEHLTEFWLV